MFDYFYDAEAEQFSFYRVPKVLFQSEAYDDISCEAKILYGILLDRVGLSQQNRWKDESGRIYIVCTIEEILRCLGCSNKKAVKLVAELEKIGLIEKKRRGLGKPNILYVKNFIRSVDNSGKVHFLKCKNDTSRNDKNASQEVSEFHAINTEKKKTDLKDTEDSIDPVDPIEEHECYDAWFRKALSFEELLLEYPYKKDLLEGILDLLVETCISKRSYIRIAAQDLPADVVKSRMMKLDINHIRYVLDSLSRSSSDVRNIKQYLLTSLYNAPVTMSAYYQVRVNHDMFAPKEGDPCEAGIGYGSY